MNNGGYYWKCHCGCNVFRQIINMEQIEEDTEYYECNSCGSTISGK